MLSNFDRLAAFHIPGDPLIFYNIWDAGSAAAVARAGAKALATGSHPVADANGWPDGEQVPIDFALANAHRIVAAVDLDRYFDLVDRDPPMPVEELAKTMIALSKAVAPARQTRHSATLTSAKAVRILLGMPPAS